MSNLDEEFVPVKIKYEYFTDKGEQKFSKDFGVKLSLDPEYFFENSVIILNECNFGTKEERIYFHMFDSEKELFIIQASQLKELAKNKKTIVMKNCSVFAKQIIQKLREGEKRYKLEKNSNADELLNSEREKDRTNMLKLFFNLKRNYLEVDLFGEEFISFEGIKHLISFLQFTSGNMRTYGIEALNKLLDFQSSIDYIRKRKEILDTLYEILMKSDTINSCLLALNALISSISQDEEKATYLIDAAENYAKKSSTPTFSQIISLLSNTRDINVKVLCFINELLTFCESGKKPQLLIQLKRAGIYEAIKKFGKNVDKNLEEQLNIFKMKVFAIIFSPEYELPIYEKHNSSEKKNDEDNILLLRKENEQLKKEQIQLNNKIKELEANNPKIKNENNNKLENNNENLGIKDLENEIKLYREYYGLSPNEKLISIKCSSFDKKIDYVIICKNTDKFSKIEDQLYKKYPNYIDTENYFMVNGKKIKRFRTLEDNEINNNDEVILYILDS